MRSPWPAATCSGGSPQAPAWQEVRRRVIPPQQLARMVAFNATGAPLPEPYLHELFAARARRQPDRTAVTGPRGSAHLRRAAADLRAPRPSPPARGGAPQHAGGGGPGAGPGAVPPILGRARGRRRVPAGRSRAPRDRFRTLLEHGRIELAVTERGPGRRARLARGDRGGDDRGCSLGESPGWPAAGALRLPKDLACVLIRSHAGEPRDREPGAGPRAALRARTRGRILARSCRGDLSLQIFGAFAASARSYSSPRKGSPCDGCGPRPPNGDPDRRPQGALDPRVVDGVRG